MEKTNAFDRRNFLKKGALSTLSILFANHLSAQELLSDLSFGKENLIAEIKLQTKLAPNEIIDFYNELIGLPVLNQTENCCSFKAGKSILSFTSNPQGSQTPFYHFAFNIPENKIRQAEEWQLKRTALIEPPAHLQDLNNYSKNIVHFRHWNARSVFFYDPAGNVVEYIARHSLPNSATGDFSSDDLLCISEIALIVDDVEEMYPVISNQFNLKKYSTSSSQFLALGDELGLLLLMQKHTRAVFRKGRKREVFETEIILNQNKQSPKLDFENYPYLIYSV